MNDRIARDWQGPRGNRAAHRIRRSQAPLTGADRARPPSGRLNPSRAPTTSASGPHLKNGNVTMNLKEQRAAALKAAQDVVSKAQTAGRDLTDNEMTTVEAKMTEVKDLDAKILKAADSRALMDRIAASDRAYDENGEPLDLDTGAKAAGLTIFQMKHAGRDLARRLMSTTGPGGVKAMPTDRVQTVPDVVDYEPIVDGRRQPSVFDLFDLRPTTSPSWTFRKAVRKDVAAAMVGTGQVKPTSQIDFVEVTNQLAVFANVGGPLPEPTLWDYPALASFLSSELLYGLQIALEDEVFSGNGGNITDATDTEKVVGKHFTGLLNASGVLDQPFSVDGVTTLAIAVQRLESDGHDVAGIALNPQDWLALTTKRNASGEFDLGGAIDAPARTIWGKGVRLTRGLPQGTSVVIAREAAALRAGQEGLQVKPIQINDDALRNLVRVRAEARWALDLYRPGGICVTHLTDTPAG